MSLKALHIVFIASSILLAFFFGGWSVNHYFHGGSGVDLLFAGGSFLSGFLLLAYARVILRKLKDISYL